MKWNVKLERELIAAIKEEEAVWNPEHPDHQRFTHIGKLWDGIAKQVKVLKDSARSKWKVLVAKFYTEYDKSETKWSLFEDMFFIKDIVPRPKACMKNKGSPIVTSEVKKTKLDLENEENTNNQKPTSVEITTPEEEIDGYWEFCVSLLPYFKSIKGELNRHQAEVECSVAIFKMALKNEEKDDPKPVQIQKEKVNIETVVIEDDDVTYPVKIEPSQELSKMLKNPLFNVRKI